MNQMKKTRGAWVIHVREINAKQSTVAKCSPIPNGGTAQCNEHKNKTDKKEE